MSARIVGGVVPDPVHVQLAARALRATVAGRRDVAAEALIEVFQAGPRAVSTLLSTVADTHIAAHERQHGQLPPDEVVAPVWVNVDTGRIAGADGVAPMWRWAGRWVAARAAGDRDQCEALLGALHQLGVDELIEHVGALLQMCALTVQSALATAARQDGGRPRG